MDMIVTSTYMGTDRRHQPPARDRRKGDRRVAVVEVFDEFGEPSKKLGEVIDILV